MLDLQGMNLSTVIYCENKNGVFENSQTWTWNYIMVIVGLR